jgi:hypothetical protein
LALAHAVFATTSATQHFDPVLVSELTRRGINEKKAHELLANLKPGQEKELGRQLEHAEQLVKESQVPVTNPAGFIIRLIEYNTPVPDGFETKAQRTVRAERERQEGERRAAKEARQQLEWEYDEYRDEETDHYIEVNAATFEALKDAKWKEDREHFTFTTESMARMAARFEMQKQITFLTFEEFLERKKQGTDLFLKPVAPSPAPELATVTQETEDTTARIDPSVAPSDPTAAAQPEAAMVPSEPAMEAATAETAEPEVSPAMPEPLMIELLSDPPQEEPGRSAAEPTLG